MSLRIMDDNENVGLIFSNENIENEQQINLYSEMRQMKDSIKGHIRHQTNINNGVMEKLSGLNNSIDKHTNSLNDSNRHINNINRNQSVFYDDLKRMKTDMVELKENIVECKSIFDEPDRPIKRKKNTNTYNTINTNMHEKNISNCVKCDNPHHKGRYTAFCKNCFEIFKNVFETTNNMYVDVIFFRRVFGWDKISFKRSIFQYLIQTQKENNYLGCNRKNTMFFRSTELTKDFFLKLENYLIECKLIKEKLVLEEFDRKFELTGDWAINLLYDTYQYMDLYYSDRYKQSKEANTEGAVFITLKLIETDLNYRWAISLFTRMSIISITSYLAGVIDGLYAAGNCD
eukprot:Pgem_evm1s9498